MAWASLSQTSDQRRGLTLSPNHWWASSCTITDSTYQSGSWPAVNRRFSKSERVWVSSSKPVLASAISTPYASKG